MERGFRVLYVEDNDDMREIFAEILEAEGFSVQSARNGREALDLLVAAPALPDVILLDLMMPVMSGVEFLEHAERHERFSTVPVVVMTAAAGVDTPPTAGRISKSAPTEEIVGLLRAVVRR